MPNRARAALVATLLGVLAAAPAAGGSFGITPTRVTLPPSGGAEVVTLENRGDGRTLVEVQAYRWDDDTTVEQLEPTGDILAVPPIFELDPGGSQIIRLALRRPVPPGREQTYRLVLTEVPDETGTSGVTFALRLNLPVFVTPPGAEPRPRWSIRRGAEGDELVIANDGSAHLHLRSVELYADAARAPVFVSDSSAYVLAGQERGFPLPTPARGPLVVRAQTNIGDLEGQVARQGS